MLERYWPGEVIPLGQPALFADSSEYNRVSLQTGTYLYDWLRIMYIWHAALVRYLRALSFCFVHPRFLPARFNIL